MSDWLVILNSHWCEVDKTLWEKRIKWGAHGNPSVIKHTSRQNFLINFWLWDILFVLRYSHGKSAPSIFRLVANKSFFQFCIYAVLANMTAKKWETCHVTWYDQVLRNTFFHIFFFSVWPKTNWLSKKSIYRVQDRRPLSHRFLDLRLPLQRYAVLPLPVQLQYLS